MEFPYDENNELVGVVFSDGTIKQLENISNSPEDSFRLRGEDLLLLDDPNVVATWHTHPKSNSNLSVTDKVSFLMWPRLKHYIKGLDGTTCYVIRGHLCVKE